MPGRAARVRAFLSGFECARLTVSGGRLSLVASSACRAGLLGDTRSRAPSTTDSAEWKRQPSGEAAVGRSPGRVAAGLAQERRRRRPCGDAGLACARPCAGPFPRAGGRAPAASLWVRTRAHAQGRSAGCRRPGAAFPRRPRRQDLDRVGGGGGEAIRGWTGGPTGPVTRPVGGWAPRLWSGRLRGWGCCFGEVSCGAFSGQ